DLSFAFVGYALRRWWRVALPMALLLGALGGALVWQFKGPSYGAFTWVRIEDQKPMLAFPERDSALFVRTQVELIKSPLVLDPVLNDRKISQLPEVAAHLASAEWMAKQVNVKSVGGSELYQIAYESRTPDNVVAIVNAVLDSYMRVQNELTDVKAQRTIEL